MSIVIPLILAATISVNPVYVKHSRVGGTTQTMTNIVQWAQDVESAVSDISSSYATKIDLNTISNLCANSATNPNFSNAVLSVGIGIDTNNIPILNEIAQGFGNFPLSTGETATTIGSLLAALVAGIAWLKKNKLTKGIDDNGSPSDSNVIEMFSVKDDQTASVSSGFLKNTVLDKSIVKVCNSIIDVPNATLESALGSDS